MTPDDFDVDYDHIFGTTLSLFFSRISFVNGVPLGELEETTRTPPY